MKQILKSDINDSIINYTRFVEKVIKHPEDTRIKEKYCIFLNLYNHYKMDSKFMSDFMNLMKVRAKSHKGNIYFYYFREEQIWAYIHLMIENLEKMELNIFKTTTSFKILSYFNEGLSRLWVSNENIIDTIVYFDLI